MSVFQLSDGRAISDQLIDEIQTMVLVREPDRLDELPSNYQVITGEMLGYNNDTQEGRVDDKGYFHADYPARDGQAIAILQDDGTIAISFRGTNSNLDLFAVNTFPNNEYIYGFDEWLASVANFAKKNGHSIDIVTGKSLGGACVNMLRDESKNIAEGAFDDATYFAVASPLVAKSDRNIINYGYTNDYAHEWYEEKIRPGAHDETSVTDNLVYYNSQYASSSWSPFLEMSAHSYNAFRNGVDALQKTHFADEMDEDSFVILAEHASVDMNRAVGRVKPNTDENYLVGVNNNNFNIQGTSENDHIDTGWGKDRIYAGSGDDVVFTDGLDDYVSGGEGNDTIDGGTGNDRLFGNQNNDTLYGGWGNDYLNGGKDDDALYGGAGNDRLFGYEGNNKLYGGDGKDYLKGSAGADMLDGGTGNDRLYGDAGVDDIKGGTGDDLVYGGYGNDTIDGGTGNDRLFGNQNNDTLYGGDGKDYLNGGKNDDKLYGGEGNDRLFGYQGSNELYGGGGNDYIKGADERDLIYGGAGNNRLFGQDGDDLIVAANGENTDNPADKNYVNGGAGNDEIYGGTGADRLIGGDGDDFIVGDEGFNRIYGGAGRDEIYGGDGRDLVYGGQDDDTISGYAGNDSFYGGDGRDILLGDKGDDILRGNADRDYLAGGAGEDLLYGGAGDDRLAGGAGEDLLYGGAGRDKFVFYADYQTPDYWDEPQPARENGQSTAMDFKLGEDKVLVEAKPHPYSTENYGGKIIVPEILAYGENDIAIVQKGTSSVDFDDVLILKNITIEDVQDYAEENGIDYWQDALLV